MTSQRINEFLTFLRECEQGFHMAEADQQDANNETQDILHSLELEKHSYHERARLATVLAGVRQRRRQAKDRMAVLAPVLDWVDGNRPVVKSLERLLGDVRKMEKNAENRIYTPRKKERS